MRLNKNDPELCFLLVFFYVHKTVREAYTNVGLNIDFTGAPVSVSGLSLVFMSHFLSDLKDLLSFALTQPCWCGVCLHPCVPAASRLLDLDEAAHQDSGDPAGF